MLVSLKCYVCFASDGLRPPNVHASHNRVHKARLFIQFLRTAKLEVFRNYNHHDHIKIKLRSHLSVLAMALQNVR